MARRQTTYTVEGGRDDGKVFVITEMPADQAEWFAWNLFLAATNEGFDISPEVMASGWSGLAKAGLSMLFKIPASKLRPLLDEMMQCAKFIPDPNKQNVSRPIDPDDIEDPSTYFKLRAEIFKLHTAFLTAVER